MPSNYGAFDENGNPIRSSVNPAFTGAPPAPPVLRELPTPAPDRLFNPNAMPQLPSVQPQTPAPSLMRRAADFVMPTAGAATLDQPGMGRRPYVGDGSNYPAPAATASLDQPAAAGVPAVRAIQPRSMMGIPAMAAPSRQEPVAHALPSRGAMGVPANGIPLPHSASGGIGKPRNYIGEGSRYAPYADPRSYTGEGQRYEPFQPQAAPELQPGQASTADYVPTYQMGPGGALTLAMPGGGTAELTPGPGANRLGVRVSELAGQKLGGGQFESDAQVAARRPDLYGADGRPLLADAFGHAVDQGLARRAAEIDARNALAAAVPNTRDLVDRGNALLDQAGKAKLARNQRDLSAEGQALLSLAAQQQTAGRNAQLQIQQDATTRRGQDMQLLGREWRNPVSVKTADGGEVLFDPGSGQWLQPPGAQGSGIAKQDHERLKGITGHIGKAMGMDSAANPIDAATGAAYTAASRIGGGAYMATRGVRQFAGYTDADFAGIGQDVAAGRATIRTGKDGMAYAIYHGENGQAYGVPIGPAENYANIQPAAGQPAAAR